MGTFKKLDLLTISILKNYFKSFRPAANDFLVVLLAMTLRFASTPCNKYCFCVSSLVIEPLYCVIRAIALSAESLVTVNPSITCWNMNETNFF
jgi:hypothetical protein